MRWFVLCTGLAMFAVLSLAVHFHFRSSERSLKFAALSLISAVNIFMFGRELWLRPKALALLAVALCLFVLAAVLFGAALWASRAARLKLIFEPDAPEAVLTEGPYRWIRHPFYASYILFWSGCAVATLQPFNIIYALVLAPLLAFAAKSEEAGFERSPHAEAYRDYQRRAGLFWPKLRP